MYESQQVSKSNWNYPILPFFCDVAVMHTDTVKPLHTALCWYTTGSGAQIGCREADTAQDYVELCISTQNHILNGYVYKCDFNLLVAWLLLGFLKRLSFCCISQALKVCITFLLEVVRSVKLLSSAIIRALVTVLCHSVDNFNLPTHGILLY